MPLIVCTDLNERVLVCADSAGNENGVEYDLYMKVTHTYIASHQGNLVYDVCMCIHTYIYICRLLV
jgi:hypothetical protein